MAEPTVARSAARIFEAWELTRRFLCAFDDIRHEGCRVARLLACPVHDWLEMGLVLDLDQRRWLDPWPGRMFLRLRSRLRRRLLRDWRGAGTVFAVPYSRGLLEDALEQVQEPWRALPILDHQVPGTPRLSELVPGNRHGWAAADTRRIYADVRRRDPELREWLPPDGAWMEALVRVAMDTLDAARVFWEVSESPGGVAYSAGWMQDIALGWMGQRLGRKVVALQHGFVYMAQVWEPEGFEAYLVWEEGAQRYIERVSEGRLRAPIIGPYGLPALPEAPAPLPVPDPDLPVVLLTTNPLSDAGWDYYMPRFRALAAEGVPWNLVWRPHPRERPQPGGLGPASVVCREQPLYDLITQADVVVGVHTGVLGQAHYYGYRVVNLAHPSEGVMVDWCRDNQVAWVAPDDDPVAAVRAALAAPPPPPRWGPGAGPEASTRLAENLDAVFTGRPLPALEGYRPSGDEGEGV